MANTPRLLLPNLATNQAQKEITHNEALNKLDAFVQTAVESMTLTAPPAGAEGNLYVVAAGATGAWAGKDKYLAQYIGGAWAFYAPFEGLKVWDKATTKSFKYSAAAWSTDGGDAKTKDRIWTPGGTNLGYDDEFDDGAIDAAWSAVDVPGYANTWIEPTGLKGISVYCPAGVGGMKVRGILKPFTALTYPFYIETAFRIISRDQNYPAAGLLFSDGNSFGSGTQVISMNVMSSQYFGIQRWTGFNTRSSYVEHSLHGGMKLPCLYLRLVWENANQFRPLFSADGITWIDSHGLQTLTITPTFFGLVISTFDNSTYPLNVMFHYFRVRSGVSVNG